MTRILIFNLLQLLASGYAMTRGGVPERLMGGAMLLAAATTYLLGEEIGSRFRDVEIGILSVDAVLLLVMLAIALKADRWWTLWIVALQTLGTGAHLARALDADVDRRAYGIMIAVWSYPMILLLLAGTWRHDRRRRVLTRQSEERGGDGDG